MMIAKDSYVDSDSLKLDAICNTLDHLVIDVFFFSLLSVTIMDKLGLRMGR